MIMSAEFACRAAYSVQLPSYKLNFEEKLLASKARKIILAVTPTLERREIHIPVPHDTGYPFVGDDSSSPPSTFHAGNPPLIMYILLCPKTLNVHHTRGDEKMP